MHIQRLSLSHLYCTFDWSHMSMFVCTNKIMYIYICILCCSGSKSVTKISLLTTRSKNTNFQKIIFVFVPYEKYLACNQLSPCFGFCWSHIYILIGENGNILSYREHMQCSILHDKLVHVYYILVTFLLHSCMKCTLT